jgi:hypothetical protein
MGLRISTGAGSSSREAGACFYPVNRMRLAVLRHYSVAKPDMLDFHAI